MEYWEWLKSGINVFLTIILSYIIFKVAKDVCKSKVSMYITIAIISLILGTIFYENDKNRIESLNNIEENINNVRNEVEKVSKVNDYLSDNLYDVFSSVENLQDTWNEFRAPIIDDTDNY